MITEQRISSLIAHRGWQKQFPENTLLAIEQAIIAGATNIEIDVQLSKDHQWFLSHDNSLERVANTNCLITESISDDLLKLSAYEPKRFGEKFYGTPLSTLDDCVNLIAQYSNIQLFVEIKEESVQAFGNDIVMDCIEQVLAPIKQQCYLISFDMDILFAAKQRGWQQIAPVIKNYQQLQSDLFEQLSPPLVFANIKRLIGKDLKQQPYPLAIYEIADSKQAVTLIEKGAHLVETFAVGEIIAELKKHPEPHNE